MKKLLSLCVLTVSCLCLATACSNGTSSEAFEGSWSYTVVESADVGLGDENLVDVDTSIILTINSDDTFVMEAEIDEDDLLVVEQMTIDYMQALLQEDTDLTGEEVLALLEENLGMTIDEYAATYVQVVVAQYQLACDDIYSEGTYIMEDDVMYLYIDDEVQDALYIEGDYLINYSGEAFTAR